MLDNKEMFKIQYEAGQGRIEIISILEKQGDAWVLLKNPILEDTISSKFLNKEHYNLHNKNMGYGQIVITDKLTYITGHFEIPKPKEQHG